VTAAAPTAAAAATAAAVAATAAAATAAADVGAADTAIAAAAATDAAGGHVGTQTGKREGGSRRAAVAPAHAQPVPTPRQRARRDATGVAHAIRAASLNRSRRSPWRSARKTAKELARRVAGGGGLDGKTVCDLRSAPCGNPP